MNIKNNKAITLISLVITIVILIILAGIVISLSIRNNGIFNRAKEAKEKTEYASALETIEVKLIDANMEKITEVERMATLEELEEYFKKDTETEVELIKYEEIAYLGKNVVRPENIKGFWVKVIKYNKYSFLIGKEAKIESLSLDNGLTKVPLEEYEKYIGKVEKGPIKNVKVNIIDINGTYFTVEVNAESSEGKIVEYEYFINGESKGITTDTNKKIITDLELDTEYSVQVKVKDEKGNTKILTGSKQKTLDKQYLIKDGEKKIDFESANNNVIKKTDNYLDVTTISTIYRAVISATIEDLNKYNYLKLDFEVIRKTGDAIIWTCTGKIGSNPLNTDYENWLEITNTNETTKERNIYLIQIDKEKEHSKIIIGKNSTHSNTYANYRIYNMWLEK